MKNKLLIIILAVVGLILVLVYSGTLKSFLAGHGNAPFNDEQLKERVSQAKWFMEEGKFESAKTLLLENLKLLDYEESTFYLLSVIYVGQKDYQKAFELAKPLVERSSNPQLLTNLGSLFAMNNYEKMASACYAKALQEDQSYIPAYVELGKLYGNQEKFVQAIGVWQDGLRLNPENENIKALIAQAHAIWEQKQ